MLNKKFLLALILLILVFISVGYKLLKPRAQAAIKSKSDTAQSATVDAKKVTIVSTNPDPLDNIIIQADQIIQITFSNPLENTAEFKHKLDPKTEHKLELSSDRKTLKITPIKPYELGSLFTLTITQDTKFDHGARLDEEKSYHFRTVKFRDF